MIDGLTLWQEYILCMFVPPLPTRPRAAYVWKKMYPGRLELKRLFRDLQSEAPAYTLASMGGGGGADKTRSGSGESA